MKLYTCYTDSHKILYDNYLSKSVHLDDYDLDTTIFPQECNTGRFYDNGWRDTTYKKIEVFIRACQENINGYFVFSDVDVQFLSRTIDDLMNEIGNNDMAIQSDGGDNLCSGFFICKCSDKTLNMFNRMLIGNYKEDQHALNEEIRINNITYTTLNIDKYFNPHYLGRRWNIGDDLKISNNILVHHANWCVGVDAKLSMLELVKNKYINNEFHRNI